MIYGGAGGAAGPTGYVGEFPNSVGSAGLGGAGLIAYSATISNTKTIAGGMGGRGGYSGNSYAGSAGNGATGGAGIFGGSLSITNSGSLTGGVGGAAGGPDGGNSGTAGTGGAGINANNTVITNSGSITGGSGGAPGNNHGYYSTGNGAMGGAGIAGSGLSITNSGSITAGAGGTASNPNSGYTGVPGAAGDAIDFTGGANSLTLQSGSTITGAISLDTSSTTLDFAQPTDSTLSSAIIGAGSITKTGRGALTLTGASTFSGGTTIDAGTLDLAVADTFVNGTVASGGAGVGAISFGAMPGTLALAAVAQPTSMSTFGNTLANFGTNDSLDLLGLTYTSGAPATPLLFTPGLFGPNFGTISVTENGETETFTLANPGAATYFAQSDGNGGTLIDSNVVCFASGTRIRTARGEVAVEHLVVGDLAVTSSGAHRPIRWIGSRLTHPRRHPRPHEIMPVRVAAHAFAPNRPARDLLVSPGHSLCVNIVDAVLIPAMALINGRTIIQEDVDSVTYWHVELEDGHDILLAENMPAESYLDMGNRGFFAESGVVDLDASPDAPVATHADFCHPFHMEGPLVEVVRAQLAARATRLGWRLEEQGLGDLHLLVNGVRIEPRVRGLAVRFTVPAGAEAVWLVSGTAVPAEIAASTDRRSLARISHRGISEFDVLACSALTSSGIVAL